MRVMLMFLPALVFASACSRSDRVGSRGEPVELEILRPESGGEMVLVPSGEFVMGDPSGRPDETPHEVRVSSFYMDKYSISQQLFAKTMGVNPSKLKREDNPVERTQWVDAARFCNKCSELEGLTPCYDPATWECDFEANGYRLPTEAEWEYACRAGSQSQYFFGDAERELPSYAWLKPHSRGRPQPVGTKRPNPWGLHDMHGNVWQWCNDYYDESYYAMSPRENPRGPATGEKRVLRGGAWSSTADKCRAAYRFNEFPVFSDACFGSDSYGFRRVRSAKASPTATASRPQTVESETPPRDEQAVAEVPSEEVAQGKIALSRLKGTIVFVSDRGGALDIWRMHASGKNLQQLTRDSNADADPRFSPDGKRIMYTSLRDGFPEIWMMSRDGSQRERIAEGSQAQWSPDGQSIVFIRDDQTHVRELGSGNERRITPEPWQRCGVPTWSPDGKQIAVASRHTEDIGIFIFAVGGAKHNQLETEEPSCTPQWSPDGQRIIFQTVKGHIHQFYIDSESEEQVTFGADIQHDPRYSPDGSMIVFCRAPTLKGPWQICIADLVSDDLDFVQITSEGSNRLPDWHVSEGE